MKKIYILIGFLIVVWFATAQDSDGANNNLAIIELPTNILFVGNSFTYFHGGIENHVRELAASETPPRVIQVESITRGGATLEINYRRSAVHEAINDGLYDVVVLQGDLPELKDRTIDSFLAHARLFDAEIRDAGATTMFYMTWPYERLNWISIEEIGDAHRDLGTELEASVAPVGIAFERSRAERPDLEMLGGDNEHQSIHGMYLAAAVVYTSLFDKSPIGLSYHPSEISEEEAAFLQRIAWETVQEWKTQ